MTTCRSRPVRRPVVVSRSAPQPPGFGRHKPNRPRVARSFEQRFWNPALAIGGFDRVREIGFRSNGLSYIPRRYCVARAAMSDQRTRTVVYAVATQTGIIGVTWGVEWCVVGVDPTLAYAPDCEVIRPILEREIGKTKWLAEYGLKPGY